MARIVLGSYMVRYPLGGNLSWILQWLVGFQRLGHDVFVAEKAGYTGSCFDPSRNCMGDDCRYGVRIVRDLLTRFGLEERFCYVDADDVYHGMGRREIEEIFSTADLFLDIGTHGAWLPQAERTRLRVLVDLEPGYRQIKWQRSLAAGQAWPQYDRFYTNGFNIGTDWSAIPTLGLAWGHVVNPVAFGLISPGEPVIGAPFTTVMNWKAHETVEYRGVTYGQKDVEFAKFLHLPHLIDARLEVAVSGDAPTPVIERAGWLVRDSRAVTHCYDSYLDYIMCSAGEFSVCKNVFAATNSGWFSDRSAAYLAAGRPVVLEETGFSRYLPCGRGLFAVESPEAAADAINRIRAEPHRHSHWALEIATEYFHSGKVLPRLLRELGL